MTGLREARNGDGVAAQPGELGRQLYSSAKSEGEVTGVPEAGGVKSGRYINLPLSTDWYGSLRLRF